MRGPEPAGSHDVRKAERISRVGLVALRRHRRADMTGLQTDDRNALLLERRVQPRRQRAGLVPDAAKLVSVRRQGGGEERKSVVEGKSVSVRVGLGGRRIIKKTTRTK